MKIRICELNVSEYPFLNSVHGNISLNQAGPLRSPWTAEYFLTCLPVFISPLPFFLHPLPYTPLFPPPELPFSMQIGLCTLVLKTLPWLSVTYMTKYKPYTRMQRQSLPTPTLRHSWSCIIYLKLVQNTFHGTKHALVVQICVSLLTAFTPSPALQDRDETLPPLLAVLPWTVYLNSMSLRFFICKIGVTVITLKDCWMTKWVNTY